MRILRAVGDFIARLWRAGTHFPVSWVEALSADGDGPPNWFWPSCQTASVIGLAWAGLYFATDKAAYVLAVLVPFGTFVTATFALWLAYRGWRGVRAPRQEKEP